VGSHSEVLKVFLIKFSSVLLFRLRDGAGFGQGKGQVLGGTKYEDY
jgi:hypothetical protein